MLEAFYRDMGWYKCRLWVFHISQTCEISHQCRDHQSRCVGEGIYGRLRGLPVSDEWKLVRKKKSISIFLISDKIYKHKRAPLRGCDISLSFYFNRVNGGRLDINGGFFMQCFRYVGVCLALPQFYLVNTKCRSFPKKRKSRLPRSLYAHTSYFLGHCFCFVHPPNII